MLDGLKYTRRCHLDVFNDHIESIYIEIQTSCINLEKHVIVGMIYRPPNRNLDDFKNSLDVILTKIKKEGKLNYLLGDHNIKLLNSDSHLPTADFFDLMYSNSYLPLINKPTRVTQQTVSLIDNIYSNCTTNIQVFKGILHTLEISDHFPVFAICPKKVVFNENKEFIYRRSLSRQNCEKFISILSEFDWDLLLREQNPQSAFTLFHKQITMFYNTCFPIKRIKIGYKTRKFWLPENIKSSIHVKNELYKKWKK